MTCRQIDITAFDRDWLPICRQVFNEGGTVTAEEGKYPFANQNWRVAAIPRIPRQGWVLSEAEGCSACVNLAMPGQTNFFDGLVQTWKHLGVTRIVGTESCRRLPDPSMPSDDSGPAPFHAICDATMDDLAGLWAFRADPVLVFDASGTWGLDVSWPDDISYIAGDDRFMDTFYEVSGGEVAVRKRFDHHMLEHGSFFVHHPENPDQWTYDFIYNDILKWPQPDWIKGSPPAY